MTILRRTPRTLSALLLALALFCTRHASLLDDVNHTPRHRRVTQARHS